MLTDKLSYVLSDRGQFVLDPNNAATTTAADMDAAFARYKGQRDASLSAGQSPTKFVLHFHGGLVDQDSILGDAITLYDAYAAGGAGYPYFFVWKSGAGETIMDWVRDRLGGIMTNQKVTAATIAAHAESKNPDYAEAVITAPTFNVLVESHQPMVAPRPRENDELLAKLTARYRTMPEAQNLQHIFDENPHSAPPQPMSLALRMNTAMTDAEVAATVRAALGPTRTATGIQVAIPLLGIDVPAILAAATYRVIWRNIHHHNHPGISTMSEEIARGFGIAWLGQQMWLEMKNDCSNAFNPTGVGTAFLDRVKTLAADGKPLPLFLIAHSAGAIYTNELMNAVAASQIPSNVTFEMVCMAAAVRSDIFSTLLQAPIAARIQTFRYFALQDPIEQACGLSEGWSGAIDFLFQASLLYVIAGILEPDVVDCPIAGMDRFIGPNTRFGVEAGDQIITDYATHARPPVWAPTNGAQLGYASTAKTHGSFPMNQQSRDSMTTLIKQWV